MSSDAEALQVAQQTIAKLEEQNRRLRVDMEYVNTPKFEEGFMTVAMGKAKKLYGETIATLKAKVANLEEENETLPRKLEMMSEGVSRAKRSLDESFENLASL